MRERQQVKEKDKRNIIVIINGQKGYGKSYFVKKTLMKVPQFKRIVVVDPESEYESIPFVSRDRDEFIEEVESVWDEKKFALRHTARDDDEEVFDIVFELGDCTLLVDEAHLYSRNKDLEQIVRRGRHRKINLILVAHRPVDLQPLYRQQSDIYISFRQTENIDIVGFKQMVDAKKANALKKLEVGEYIVLKTPPQSHLFISQAKNSDKLMKNFVE